MALPLIGVLVGGRAQRMGGFPKGLLRSGDQSILERTLEACGAAALQRGAPGELPCVYLVGNSAAYTEPLPRLGDEPSGIGPLGGVRALLREAERSRLPAVALSCDLPFISPELVARVLFEAPGAGLLAPRHEGRWQPLFARYRPEIALPAVERALSAGRFSLQFLFDAVGSDAVVLELSERERQQLQDWDRPSDVFGGCPTPLT